MEPVLGLVVCAVAMAVLASVRRRAGARERLVLRVLRGLQRSEVAVFPEGPGAAIGCIAVGPTMLTAPLSGRRCVAYHLAVFRLHEPGGWIPVGVHQKCADFELQDDTGSLLVYGATAELALAHPEVADDRTERGRSLLVSRGFELSPQVRARLVESVLMEGDEAVVCGVGLRELDPRARRAAGYRSSPGTRLVLRATESFPLGISNLRAVRRQSLFQLHPGIALRRIRRNHSAP